MALKQLLADLSIISKLGDNPSVDDSLSAEQLKAKFDEAANLIKDYINNYLLPELDKTVDVDALLSDILDVTLSKSDKAANAAATGAEFRALCSFFEKVVHGGDFVLDSDGCFSAELTGANIIRISGGEGVMQGNLFALNLGTYQDIVLADGAYGLLRNDLVVVRCIKNEDASLSYSLVALTGTNTSGAPVDPVYTEGDINSNDPQRDFPLYRVCFDGNDIAEIVPLFEVQQNMSEYFQGYAATKIRSATLLASGWSESVPYTQSVEIEGLSDDLRATAYPAWPDSLSDKLALSEETAKVRCCTRSGSALTFECWEDKPALDIPVTVEVYV